MTLNLVMNPADPTTDRGLSVSFFVVRFEKNLEKDKFVFHEY